MKKLANQKSIEFSFTEIEKKIESKALYSLILVVFLTNLFFIQALRGYVPGVYASMFHVVFGHNIAENLLVLLTLGFFVLPALTKTICKKFEKKRVMVYSIYIVAILRLVIAFHLPNSLQTVLCGVLITFYGFFMSTFLTLWMEEKNHIELNHKTLIVFFCILCAFLTDYLIRTIGFTQDVSLLPPELIADFWYVTQYLWLIVQIPLTVICVHYTRLHFPRFSSNKTVENQKKDTLSTKYSLIFVGMGIFFFFQFNIFLYPNVIAHYTNTNYYFNNIGSIIATILALIIIFRAKRDFFTDVKKVGILNGFLILTLFLFLFLGTVPILNYVVSVFVLISMIVMYLDFYLLFTRMLMIEFKWEKIKTISNIFAITFVFYILFSVLHILTIDWAYVISAFKGFGPLIILLAGAIFSISSIISIKIDSNKEVSRDNE